MANEKILVVEDDSELLKIMVEFLKVEQYQVFTAQDGIQAVELAKEQQPELILLDLMLPKQDGVEVCKQIRELSHAPIIIISAKSSDYDKILTLGVGADDYLTKPFSLMEMVARVKSQIRRFTTFASSSKQPDNTNEVREFGALKIYPNSYKVMLKEKEISFTSREFLIINYLSEHDKNVFTKEQLMNQVWGFSEYVDENTIAVYVGRIREKFSKVGLKPIKTVWGVGYKWEL
ncbi:MAG: response regulator transcription factor [bacterium]|nr:response regulator transcription factor [bacterium]